MAHNLLFFSSCIGCLCHWMEAFIAGCWKFFSFLFYSPRTHKDLAAGGHWCISNAGNTVGRCFRTILCFCSKGHDCLCQYWSDSCERIQVSTENMRFIEWWWTMEATFEFFLEAGQIEIKSRLLGALSSQLLLSKDRDFPVSLNNFFHWLITLMIIKCVNMFLLGILQDFSWFLLAVHLNTLRVSTQTILRKSCCGL